MDWMGWIGRGVWDSGGRVYVAGYVYNIMDDWDR